MAAEVIRRSFARRKRGKDRKRKSVVNEPRFCRMYEEFSRETMEEIRGTCAGSVENLVFEGGGTKCLAYVGAVQVLDELGMLDGIKRYAGTSGGAIIATLLALGLNVTEIKQVMEQNLKHLIYDSVGMVSAVPNIVRKYGWNPAAKITDFIKQAIKERTGSIETTFYELYKKRGKELCVVACNLTTMSIEYFHPKTTPDASIAMAVRSSMSIPGLMQPVKMNQSSMRHYFVDGGIVCNYPLHVFDGWFLSMKAEDSFFHNLGVNLKPFATLNEKTLGFVVYSCDEPELMKGDLNARLQGRKTPRPDTPLANSRAARCDRILAANASRRRLLEAGQRFLAHLRAADLNRDGTISLSEFEESLEKNQLPNEDIETLFGKQFKIHDIFRELDADGSGMITFDEFLCHMQSKGVALRAMMEGSNMADIQNLGDFTSVMFETISNQTRRVFFKPHDLDRTAGIPVDYIQTCDFALSSGDKNFLIEQGTLGCLAYFTDKLKRTCGAKMEEIDVETPITDTIITGFPEEEEEEEEDGEPVITPGLVQEEITSPVLAAPAKSKPESPSEEEGAFVITKITTVTLTTAKGELVKQSRSSHSQTLHDSSVETVFQAARNSSPLPTGVTSNCSFSTSQQNSPGVTRIKPIAGNVISPRTATADVTSSGDVNHTLESGKSAEELPCDENSYMSHDVTHANDNEQSDDVTDTVSHITSKDVTNTDNKRLSHEVNNITFDAVQITNDTIHHDDVMYKQDNTPYNDVMKNVHDKLIDNARVERDNKSGNDVTIMDYELD